MITLDTSAILVLVNRRDPEFARLERALSHSRPPHFVPMGIFSEATYMIELRHGSAILNAFLGHLQNGPTTLDCGVEDIPRIRALIDRYRDMQLCAADASVIACAERNGGRVLTLDSRHFGVVAREGTITLFP